MTTLEDELRAALRAEAQTLTVPERPALDAGAAALPHDPRRRWLVAAACLALVVAGVVSIDPRRDDERTTVTSDADAGPPTPASNGWIALDAGGESSRRVELVKPGEDVRSLDVPGSDDATEGCAAWSPLQRSRTLPHTARAVARATLRWIR